MCSGRVFRLCRVRKLLNGFCMLFIEFCRNVICLVSGVLLLIMIMLLIMFEWLLRYLVVECSIRLVFSSSGCCSIGEVKVLFIIMIRLWCLVMVVIVVMFMIFSIGLVGVLIQIIFVFGVIEVLKVVRLVRLMKLKFSLVVWWCMCLNRWKLLLQMLFMVIMWLLVFSSLIMVELVVMFEVKVKSWVLFFSEVMQCLQVKWVGLWVCEYLKFWCLFGLDWVQVEVVQIGGIIVLVLGLGDWLLWMVSVVRVSVWLGEEELDMLFFEWC